MRNGLDRHGVHRNSPYSPVHTGAYFGCRIHPSLIAIYGCSNGLGSSNAPTAIHPTHSRNAAQSTWPTRPHRNHNHQWTFNLDTDIMVSKATSAARDAAADAAAAGAAGADAAISS